MTMDAGALQTALEDLFADPPATRADCAQAWADAVAEYFSGIVPPSTPTGTAAATLSTALTAAFVGGVSATTAAAMEAAFAAFALTVAGGMAPLFTGAPPAAPIGIPALFIPPFPTTHAAAAVIWAEAIAAWATSGTATLVAPPNTVSTWA